MRNAYYLSQKSQKKKKHGDWKKWTLKSIRTENINYSPSSIPIIINPHSGLISPQCLFLNTTYLLLTTKAKHARHVKSHGLKASHLNSDMIQMPEQSARKFSLNMINILSFNVKGDIIGNISREIKNLRIKRNAKIKTL